MLARSSVDVLAHWSGSRSLCRSPFFRPRLPRASQAEGNPDYPLIGVSDATIMTLIPATTYFTTDTATGAYKNVGSVGNRCHVDCSNRGA